jgi:large subunit ribosomal protein L21
MFAVIKTGGKQYRVAADDLISVSKIGGAPGDTVQFGDVLLLGGDKVEMGSPTVAGASVAGEVVEQGRGAKIIAFKKRRRQNSRRQRGHRQEFTLVRITEILTEGRKPTPRPKAETQKRAVAAQAPVEAGEAADERKPPRKKQPVKAKPGKPRGQKEKTGTKSAQKQGKSSAKRAGKEGPSKGKRK